VKYCCVLVGVWWFVSSYQVFCSSFTAGFGWEQAGGTLNQGLFQNIFDGWRLYVLQQVN